MTETLVVPQRFRGPAGSANGGWTCGALAAVLGSGQTAVSVRLSAPPPLDVPLSITRFSLGGSRFGARLHEVTAGGERLIAEATRADPEQDDDLRPVPALDPDPDVAFDLAVQAGERYGGRTDHPFPTCLVCGTGREPGDGLLLRPGPGDPPDGTVSAAWTPHPALDDGTGHVDLAMTWAALDCPGGWSADLRGRPMVLGTMTARVDQRPRIGEPCVVRGALAGEGSARTVPTRTTLYGPDGEILAVAGQVWVVVDPALFNG